MYIECLPCLFLLSVISSENLFVVQEGFIIHNVIS